MNDIAELKLLIIKQQEALGVTAEFLGRVMLSRTKFADEATGVLSHVINAGKAVNDAIDRDIYRAPLSGKAN